MPSIVIKLHVKMKQKETTFFQNNLQFSNTPKQQVSLFLKQLSSKQYFSLKSASTVLHGFRPQRKIFCEYIFSNIRAKFSNKTFDAFLGQMKQMVPDKLVGRFTSIGVKKPLKTCWKASLSPKVLTKKLPWHQSFPNLKVHT